MNEAPSGAAQRRIVALGNAEIEVLLGNAQGEEPTLCFAHPAERLGPATVDLLAEVLGRRIICTNPRGREGTRVPSLEEMVERIEGVRLGLGVGPWVFWGMSGGGWLAQLYAHHFPGALRGVVIESACLCFRERLADPRCVLSPFFPAWRERLLTAGLLSEESHRTPGSGDDTVWVELEGVGQVFRQRHGPALLVSPAPLSPEMMDIMPRLWAFDARPWIRSVRVPALVLCGSDDPLVPVDHAAAVHEALAGSRFVIIEGAGHTPVAQRHPEVTAAFARFAAGGSRPG